MLPIPPFLGLNWQQAAMIMGKPASNARKVRHMNTQVYKNCGFQDCLISDTVYVGYNLDVVVKVMFGKGIGVCNIYLHQ